MSRSATIGGGGAPRSLLAERTVVIACSRLPSASRRRAASRWPNHESWLRRFASALSMPSCNETEARPGSPRSKATRVEVR